MDKKKPIGYGKKDRDEMKALIERTEPKSGDYVGSGTVTEVPKKKKKMKRMQMGGKVMNPALAAAVSGASPRGTGTNDGGPAPSAMGNLGAVKTPTRGPAMPYGGMGGPVKTGIPVRPSPGADSRLIKTPFGIRLEGKPSPVRGGDAMTRPGFPVRGGGGVPVQGPMGRPFYGKGSERPGMPKMREYGMKGGGLARKGVGMALAKGGLVKANGCAQRGKTKGKMV